MTFNVSCFVCPVLMILFLHEFMLDSVVWIILLAHALSGVTFLGWWNDLLHGKIYKEIDHSGKMVLLMEILTMSSDVGDKVLVFSQSIPTLDLIELYLSRIPRRGKRGKF